MKSWEVWTWDGHPCLLLSNQGRLDRKPRVVVLKGQTIYSGDPAPSPLEAVLDVEDGLDRRTVFVCDLLWTAEKKDISQRRGAVLSHDRRADISRKVIQGLALAGY